MTEASPRRPVLVTAARALIEEAGARRAGLRQGSAAWHFYLGVERAAETVLHPELGAAHTDEWLQREPPAFREGYTEATALLGIAAGSREPPAHLPLPEYRPEYRG